jgi:ABC-2 type transport system ATP-binding protein
MIRVSELTKDFGSRRAIDSLNFHAEKGEILGFLGPNGAGKTTTMRILTGYMPPTSGKAELGGFDVIDQSIKVREIVGYLPETIPLYPDMTIFGYLKFMAELRKLKDIEDRIDDVLEMVQLEDRAESFIANLSKGMRQRVGIAQALLHEPQILILDEPTIGLDPAQILEVRNIIKDIGKEKTVLLSTHILSEAQQVCNRVLIINKGKIVAEDSPDSLQARLSGAQRVIVQVRAATLEDIKRITGNIEGLRDIKCLQDDSSYEFETSPGHDARPEIARSIVAAGYDLLDIHLASLSLEEIFLQLTRDDSPIDDISSQERL